MEPMELNPAALTGPESQGRTDRDRRNLIDFSPASEAVSPGFWRALIIDALSVITALFFGYSYFLYLTEGVSPWYTVAGLILFGIVSALQVLIAQSGGRRTLIILAETVAMTAAFAFFDSILVVSIAAGLVFLSLLWGYLAGRAEMKNQVELGFWKISSGTVGKVATAAILFLLVVYAPQAQGQGIFLPRSSFRTFFSWSSGALDRLYPGVAFNDSFGKFATGFARQELSDNPSFERLSPAEQQAVVAQAASSIASNVAKATGGAAPASNASMSDVAYDYIVSTLRNWQNTFKSRFLIVWVIVLFLVFRTLGFIFVWVVQLLGIIVYEILLAAKFMRIEGAPRTKETIVY